MCRSALISVTSQLTMPPTLAKPLMERFSNGDLDAVDVVFAKFNSGL